jgi:probable selenium-dependent hydroxylase accessory protein YqeC
VESLSVWFEQLIFGLAGSRGRETGDSAKSGPVVITFIGSGGKSSLIELLAKKLTHNNWQTLVATTTKMFPLPKIPGVTQAGILNSESGKLESLPLPELERITGGYDLVLIEGDGAKTLPLKGWADYEPVVPEFTTVTVGVIPVWPLGQKADETIIHRLPLFCKLAKIKPGEIISPIHLTAVIERGLFAKAKGKKILFFNQIEDKISLAAVREITALLQPAFRSSLSGIIAGSVHLRGLSCQSYPYFL